MIERLALGTIPRKHHIQLKDASGRLHWVQCLTQDGFEVLFGPAARHRSAAWRTVASRLESGFSTPAFSARNTSPMAVAMAARPVRTGHAQASHAVG
jgi:hypothetical protein